jgi:hypothetical protein
MILCPEGWREWRAGEVYMYAPLDGRLGGYLTYAERVSPIRSLATMLEETIAEDEEFERTKTFGIGRFITDEGEYGGRIAATGMHHGIPIAHVVVSVFAEDFCTRLTARVGAARLEEYAALLTTLATGDRLALGKRRRRVAFRPPPGWHAVPGLTLDLEFFPPDYPRERVCIVVFAAEPLEFRDPEALQREHDARLGLAPVDSQSRNVRNRRSLPGHVHRSIHVLPDGQGTMVRDLAILRGNEYSYRVRMEALQEHKRELHQLNFEGVVNSIEPIPSPRLIRGAHPSFVSDWSD